MHSSALQIRITNNWLFVVVAIFCLVMGFAYPNIQSSARPAEQIVSGIQYWIEPQSGTSASLTSVMSLNASEWQNDPQNMQSFGMSNAPHWFKFSLPQIDYQHHWLLSIDYPLLDEIELWFEDNGEILAHFETGDSVSFAERPIQHENFLFPVPPVKQLLTVYVRVRTTGAVRLPINIWQENHYLNFASQHSMIMGLFFGFLLAMCISNLFLYLTTRVSTFAVYCGYVGFLGLSLATLHGLAYQHLWPQSPWLQQHALPVFANLTVAFSMIFCDLLLNVEQHSRRLSRLLKVLAALYFFSMLVSLFAPLNMLVSVFLIMLLASGALIYGLGIWLWWKGVSVAGVYTLAWSVLFFSGFVVCLDNLNIVKLNLPSDYLMALGAAIETLLLALVLAINHNQQRQALQLAQQQLLTKALQEKHNQDEILNLQESAKEELEYKVQERTLELEIALRELSETNRELQEKNTLDSLTGVRNRSYFDKKYLAEIRRSRRERTQLSVVMLDIDHFKNINDKFGHLVGDECIKSVANILKQAVKRPSDDVCRYGGEEFVVILPSTELQGATQFVEQIRQHVADTVIQVGDAKVKLTVSAGIATAIVHPQQAENTLLSAADQQLYLAKDAGRNLVKGIFLTEDPDLNQETT